MPQPSWRPGSDSLRARAWALRRFRLSRRAAAERSCPDLWAGLDGTLECPDDFGDDSGLSDDIAALWRSCSPSYPTPVPGSTETRCATLRLGSGAARGLPRIHQALKGADILAVAPSALEVLPPAAHDDDHDPSPRIDSRPDAPVSWGVGYRAAMIGRWLNCGKLMKATEKSGFFQALPWLAQSGIVRAVFRGRHPARPPGAAVAQW